MKIDIITAFTSRTPALDAFEIRRRLVREVMTPRGEVVARRWPSLCADAGKGGQTADAFSPTLAGDDEPDRPTHRLRRAAAVAPESLRRIISNVPHNYFANDISA